MVVDILKWLKKITTFCNEQDVVRKVIYNSNYVVNIGPFQNQMEACRTANIVQEILKLKDDQLKITEILGKPVLINDGINQDKAE